MVLPLGEGGSGLKLRDASVSINSLIMHHVFEGRTVDKWYKCQAHVFWGFF